MAICPRFTIFALAILCGLFSAGREAVSLDDNWTFAFGHTDPAKDFNCGTEYFNYLTKVNSIHNTGPYAPAFCDSAWAVVDLPFDFASVLPYSPEASHSHGYKTIGHKYPASSVGWYRKHFSLSEADSRCRFLLRFEGIYRDSRVWVNGFYLGSEQSGYTEQTYDITPYLRFDGDNLIAVRADASLEEGWYYEGAGIYRHVWLEKYPEIHIVPESLRATFDNNKIIVAGRVENHSHSLRDQGVTVSITLTPVGSSATPGGVSSTAISIPCELPPRGEYSWSVELRPDSVSLWSPTSPALYDITAAITGSAPDSVSVRTGFRTIEMSPDSGLSINGRHITMRGVNLHQDHAGVGVGLPDAVWLYRLRELKKYGVNTIRTAHHPTSPALLAIADSLGFLVVEENRLPGINNYHVSQLCRMVERDRNHPSILLWSVANEEWGIDNDPRGAELIAEIRDIMHRLDPSRMMTVATSGGPSVIETPDVAGYNYLLQNNIDRRRQLFPDRIAFGSEETTGCGSRGIYFDSDSLCGRMPSLNRRHDADHDSCLNRIGRGWKFYRDRPWLLGVCFWTGFDYRGEPNPLKFPATGSQFGLLDYCGFPKDEAFYLKAQWTDAPLLHILPHWNLKGREGQPIDIWVYTNLDEVELSVNSRSLGRQRVEPGGFASFTAPFSPGRVVAKGFRCGRRVAVQTIMTAGVPAKVDAEPVCEANGVKIINVTLRDSHGIFTPTACPILRISLPEGTRLLGCGNGDPAIQAPECPAPGSHPEYFDFPAFNGHAQFIIQSSSDSLPSITII